VVVGIGIDIVEIARIRQLMTRWQDRFLRRVFTETELEYALRRHDPAQHLAARFAAKEATLKALGTGLSMGVRWREMEVRADGRARRSPGGPAPPRVAGARRRAGRGAGPRRGRGRVAMTRRRT
jgi:holo-[acyl-carrier-protein] synthase